MTAVNAGSTKAAPISVTADTTKGVIHGTAEINAPPERIFRALTTAEQAEWWGHEGVYRTYDYEIDLRPGGKWGCKVTMAKGDQSIVGGEYITVDPPRLLEYTVEAKLGQFRRDKSADRDYAHWCGLAVDHHSHRLHRPRADGAESRRRMDSRVRLAHGIPRDEIKLRRCRSSNRLDVLTADCFLQRCFLLNYGIRFGAVV